MLNHLRPAIVCFASLTLITGVLYPALITGIATVAFSDQATGSLIRQNGRVVGSTLIAQPFSDARYFWPRPSAANYDAAAGSGSNLGPNNPALAEAVSARVAALRASDPGFTSVVPVDLVTTSGSGLDPHISVDAARVQVNRVARARGISDREVLSLMDASTEGRTAGVLGEPRVNVLRLNLALDHRLNETAHASVVSESAFGWRRRGFSSDPK